jgi:hypothetical protein
MAAASLRVHAGDRERVNPPRYDGERREARISGDRNAGKKPAKRPALQQGDADSIPPTCLSRSSRSSLRRGQGDWRW